MARRHRKKNFLAWRLIKERREREKAPENLRMNVFFKEKNMDIDLNAVSPEHITFLKDALYTHTRQVEEFCRAECQRVREDIADANLRAQAPLRSRRLVQQLEDLLKSARNSENLLRAVNLEQLEARTERLQHLLDETAEDEFTSADIEVA